MLEHVGTLSLGQTSQVRRLCRQICGASIRSFWCGRFGGKPPLRYSWLCFCSEKWYLQSYDSRRDYTTQHGQGLRMSQGAAKPRATALGDPQVFDCDRFLYDFMTL